MMAAFTMNAPRSRSVPAIRSLDRGTEQEGESAAFPVLQPEVSNDPRVPSWIQELANARAGRHSRASSVVSTRTRFSTTTFDDTRSIDIQAGGQTFRISRHGDRVTDTTAPPPYPGPNSDESTIQQFDELSPAELDEQHDDRHGFDHGRLSHHLLHHHHHHGNTSRRHGRRVRIAMPGEDGSESPNNDGSVTADTPSRVITDDELRQIILDLPIRLQTVLGIDTDQMQHQAISGVEVTSTNPTENAGSSLEQQDHLVASDSRISSLDERQNNASQMRGILRNAPSNAPYNMDSNTSDRGERRRFPFRDILWNTYKNAKGPHDPEDIDNGIGTGNSDSSKMLQPQQDVTVLPTVGDLNELSQVYNKVIRELDHEHRKQLHARDKELDQLRILLHEKDVVYRQQLKGKDFVIDDLKNRLDRLEETMEQKIERAAHEVEDLWEMRWKEHSKQLMEKCGLIKPVPQSFTTSATQTED